MEFWFWKIQMKTPFSPYFQLPRMEMVVLITSGISQKPQSPFSYNFLKFQGYRWGFSSSEKTYNLFQIHKGR